MRIHRKDILVDIVLYPGDLLEVVMAKNEYWDINLQKEIGQELRKRIDLNMNLIEKEKSNIPKYFK